MSGPVRMRRPSPPVDDDPAHAYARFADAVTKFTQSLDDPTHGLKAKITLIEARVGQIERKMLLVTDAFRLGPDHKGGESRSVVGMTPLQIAFGVVGMFGSTVGVITLIQIFAPAIAAFSHVLAHGVMTHATPAG